MDNYEYDDDSPENDLEDHEKIGLQDGMDYEVDLDELYSDPLSMQEQTNLGNILAQHPDIEVTVDYEINIASAEPENNYPRQITDVKLTPYVSNANISEEVKQFLLNLISNSLTIKQNIATKYGDESYVG